MTEEGKIKAEILDYLNQIPRCYVRNLQIGGIRGRKNTARGMADIIGVYQGAALAIEVKTRTGVASDEQREFLMRWGMAGGIGFVARSLDDVVNALKFYHARVK